MKTIFTLIFGMISLWNFAQIQTNKKPTTELYGYYQAGDSFETMQPKIEDYEAIMARQGYTFTRINQGATNDYKMYWSRNFEDGKTAKATIHYQFLVPYFKIKVDEMSLNYPDGSSLNILKNLDTEFAQKLFQSFYTTYFSALVNLLQPLKTLTKEELNHAIKNFENGTPAQP